ncbi:MAG: hypothetical protein PHQ35_11285 [Phycisphaerae bacterium]|nr:hypothetical protein [Phycisphaerae bacterium]
MKTLQTKKGYIALCWSGLASVPPRAFQPADIKTTMEVIKILKESIPDFVASITEGEQIDADIKVDLIPAEKIEEVRGDYNKRASLLERNEGQKDVTVEFTPEAFNTFFQQFTNWGRMWFNRITDFADFQEAMDATNKQSK